MFSIDLLLYYCVLKTAWMHCNWVLRMCFMGDQGSQVLGFMKMKEGVEHVLPRIFKTRAKKNVTV